MQQYFSDLDLSKADHVDLDKDVLYHLKKVLRANEGYSFRVADVNGSIYLCALNGDKAIINERLNEDNELAVEITAIISLIKNDKMDLCVQKLTELGVRRIVPYEAYRSVVKPGKGNNKLDRLRKIAREAAEQSHRNFIPEICEPCNIDDLKRHMSDINVVAYEKDDKINSEFNGYKSISFIIGPEGGFEPSEIDKLINIGFYSLSLGKRILRAETASIYLCSLIVGDNQ